MPRPIEGSVLDLPADPRVALLWVTNIPRGGPIKKKRKKEEPIERPMDLGEERHHELVSAIKGLKVSQSATQVANVEQALEQRREWRG